MEGTLIFTHIPKTAGTSLSKSAIFPNVPADGVYWFQGIGKLLRDRPRGKDVVLGHFPYGVHRALGQGPFRYLTVLRDPVDRAVSFYNYVLLCERGNPGHPGDYAWHPALPDAKRYSIDRFYEIELYRNVQTKFTAGFLWNRPRERAPQWVRERVLPERRMLEIAQRNLLERYWYFGLLDRIEEAQETIAAALGGANTRARDRSRQTKGSEGTVAPSPRELERIRELNSLDVALYDFAVEHYDKRTTTAPESE